MKPIKFLLTILFLINFATRSQAQFGNVWTFGKGYGVDFNSGQPVQLTANSMSSVEGCASVCDSSGQLLFYTNGETIWDRNNDVMLNGDSIGGHQSSTQSALILPFPNHSKLYFVFTTNHSGNGGTREMDYSIVDMSLNNSFGEVTSKNQFLEDSVCEKLTATRHCNGQDWWIVARKGNSDYFVSNLLTSTGISSSPVFSPSSIPLFGFCGSSGHIFGQMKISPNGKFIASAYSGCGLEILSFNNLTGATGNVIFREVQFPDLRIYGISFNQFSSKLMAGYRLEFPFPLSNQIDLAIYSLDTLDQQSIMQSRIFLPINDSITPPYDNVGVFGSFQLGPDNNVYGAGIVQDTIWGGVRLLMLRIKDSTNPIVERMPFYFQAFGNNPGNGLPNTYDGIYTNHHKASLRLPLCNSPFSFDSIPFYDSLLTVTRDYSWDFGDPGSGGGNFSNLQHPVHQYASTGTYTVTLTLESDCNPIVVSQQVLVSQVPLASPIITLNMGYLESGPSDNYQWYYEGAPIAGAVFQQYFPTQTGNYTVQISNASGCTASSSAFNVTSVQLNEQTGISTFTVLQNNNRLLLQCHPLSDCFQTIELIDLQGRVLQTHAYQQKQNKVEININELNSGVYLLRVNGREVRKVLRE